MQHADAMTLDQKRDFYRDGYVILKNVVPQDMVDAAHARIESRKEGENLAKAQAMTELVNATPVTPILNEAMGRFDPPIAAQVGVIPVSNPGKHFNSLGYRDQDMPYYGAQTHWTATSSSGLPAAGGPPDRPCSPYPRPGFISTASIVATLPDSHLSNRRGRDRPHRFPHPRLGRLPVRPRGHSPRHPTRGRRSS